MSDKEFESWWLERITLPKIKFNPPHVFPPCEFDFGVKKVRFEKEFVGTGSCNEKLFRVKDSKKEIPFKRVILAERYIDDIVDWLNENVPYKPCKSFNEAVWDAIDCLWYKEQIEVSELDGEFIIHEIKPTNIVVPDIKHELDKYNVHVNYQKIDSCRNVFIIKEKNDGC